MKNILFLLLALSLSGCFRNGSQINTGLEGKPMPSFNFLLMDSTTKINSKDIPSEGPIVIFYFSPMCPYCRALTKDIIDNIKLFKNVRIYLLSNFSFNLIKQYYTAYQIKNYSNIVVGQDYNVYFSNYYKPKGVPYIAIYGSDKKLKQVLLGKVEASLIKDIAFK